MGVGVGGRPRREGIYVYIPLSHFTVQRKLTQSCKAIILPGFFLYDYGVIGFPDSSVGTESACNAGDPSLISRSGRFPGEGKG